MTNADNYIEFERVSKAFWQPDGRLQTVLDDVSFFVARGETVAILGRSGVGKSVTLKNIVGFLKPDSGSIRVDGREITTMEEAELAEVRRRMSMVFQSGALFDSLTVAENVAFPMRERALQDGREADEAEVRRKVDELLATVELSEQANDMPADLSTGMKRAVAIARALASEPDCLLYDEPTTMVDPLMAQTITRLLLRLKERFHKTSVVVTHDVRLAERVADRLVMLEEGKVSFFGTPEEWAASKEPEVERFRALDALPGLATSG